MNALQIHSDSGPAIAPLIEVESVVESRALAVHCYGLTDPGLLRERNEDQFLIAELGRTMPRRQSSLPEIASRDGDEHGHLFLVADGVGGSRGGQEASALAVRIIEDFALNTLTWCHDVDWRQADRVMAELRAMLRYTHARIVEEMLSHPELEGMATTATLAYCVGATAFVVHVGDSRCYLFRGRALHRLTRDHTLVEEMVRRGVVKPEQAPQHRLRHVVNNVVGGKRVGLEVETQRFELKPYDMLLLCSDGLTEMLSDPEIAAVLEAERDPRAACERLVAEANQRGGKDNVTVVVTQFE
jgi:protein phosphatase